MHFFCLVSITRLGKLLNLLYTNHTNYCSTLGYVTHTHTQTHTSTFCLPLPPLSLPLRLGMIVLGKDTPHTHS